jgi:hypothetical protein
MSLYLAEDHRIVFESDEIVAVSQQGKVEVWDEMRETFYGFLPENATAEDVQNAMKFFKEGFKRGEHFGQRKAKSDIREALGLWPQSLAAIALGGNVWLGDRIFYYTTKQMNDQYSEALARQEQAQADYNECLAEDLTAEVTTEQWDDEVF